MHTHGFTLVRQERLTEVSGLAKLWRHEATGAELLSIVNADENKCFGVTFRTPPSDSTGVPHILEHSVLCGSEKYPVKEPFVELLKGSLQTFLNAFTFPDKTCYPVASANLRDFYNLVGVYLDAVFFPRITPGIFQQEGWHVEADAPEKTDLSTATAEPLLAYKGVVFNEMKGVYSSPDSLLAEESQHAVFPDNLYALDSGGNPEDITRLTYTAFKEFHTTLYSPSNARFFFWGDDPEEARFAQLTPYLERFKRREVHSDVPLQPRRDTPRHLEIAYAASEDENRAHITVNWLLCESADTEEMLCLDMLEHILQGLPGSPLRKALIESGLGEDMTGGGLETDLRQAFYSVGLRSIAPEKAQDVEILIMETLARLADEGVPEAAVEAALNCLEFHLRENNTGSFPRGLSAMVQSLSTWLYDGDPFAALAWEKPLAAIKHRLTAKEKVFENAIRRWFLDNTHRAIVVLLPDAQLSAQREAAEQARLAALRTALSPAELTELVRNTTALRQAQQTPDSPADLATIPGLGLADLPRENTHIPSVTGHAGTFTTLSHDLDTTGIVYASLLLPLTAVPAELMPLVPLFARALTEMGTAVHDFVDLGVLIASKTGSLSAGPAFATHHASSTPVAHLHVGGKATAEKSQDFFALMAEILLETRFDNQDRFTQMVLEERARKEQSLVPGGHGVVSARLRAHYSVAGWLTELTSGITYLDFLRRLSDRVVTAWPSVLADLENLRARIIRGNDALMNLTADSATLAKVDSLAADLARALPQAAFAPALWNPAVYPAGEALLVPAQVNYVGKGANLYELGYQWHGSAHVITRHLRMTWLWDQVRVQGGAYGAFCALDRSTGGLNQVSYRDPNVEKTLAVYDGCADYLRTLKLSDRELELAIVGAIGDFDAYQLPDAKGSTALGRYLCGDDEALLQRLRDEALSTTRKHFRDFAEVMAEAAKVGQICVLGGSAAETAAQNHGWVTTKLL